jgi:hypothetical protein
MSNLISVVVPVYKNPQSAATSRFVVEQGGPPCEIMAVDDGSARSFRKIVRNCRSFACWDIQYQARHGSRGLS